MKISTRARYGFRALLELALHMGKEPVLLREIAARQEIPLPYLEHLIAPLIAGGIMRSTKGPRGGVSLAKAPEEIRLNEVMQLLEGSMALVECVNDPVVCKRSGFCVTRDIWSELKDVMDGVLGSITLQDLVDRHKKKEQLKPEMYYI